MLMKKKGQNTNLILSVAIAVIIGVVMLGVVWTMIQNRTTTFSGSQDYINITYGNVDYTLTDSDINLIVSEDTIVNASDDFDMTSNCNITTKSGGGGIITCDEGYGNLTNGVLINGTYTFSKSGYYTGSATRTIGNIIPVLLAVGLIGVIALIYGFKRD